MQEQLIRITPNKEKAESILKMVETTLELIQTIDQVKFPSHVTKEYYDVIRELMSSILLLDGYKTLGDGAHKVIIGYMDSTYTELTRDEISLIDDLRILRNKIAYDGFFVKEEYVKRNITRITLIISKLKAILLKKLSA